MKTPASAVFAAVAMWGCSATPPAPTERDVAFICTNGESLSLRFSASTNTATLMRHTDRLELQQRPSASGFVYSNGPHTIRGKGDELVVETGRMVPLVCKVRQGPT